MKSIRILLFVLLTMTVCFTFIACSSNSGSEQKTEKKEKDKSGPEYTSAYICPMHCAGSGSDKPGYCSVCKMALRPNKDYVVPETDGDSYEHGEEGHFHTDPEEVPEEDRPEGEE